jgi:predicted nucleic acid-binding protein
MTKVNLDLPEEVFSARRLTPDDFVRDMRLAAALGIPVRGTLGIVLNAKQQGAIPAARPVLE